MKIFIKGYTFDILSIKMNLKLLNKTIRKIYEEKVSLEEVREVALFQRKKYKHLNIYISEEEESNIKLGIPMSIKDVFLKEGGLTTAGSKMLSNFIAPYSSTLVKRMENHGFVSYGKTNLDEFAMGSTGISSFYGPVRSIWTNKAGLEFSPGGSSSGAAMSVATGSAYVALATDTSGSIRLPASWSGLVGFKPTYGVFSRFGIIPLAESWDHPGLLARRVDDIRYVFHKIIGKDENDLTSVNYSPKRTDYKKFGVLKELYETNNFELDKNIKKVEDFFLKIGYEKKEYSIKELEASIAIYVILCRAECSSNLQRYDGIRFGFDDKSNNLMDKYFNTRGEGFGIEVKRRILTGAFVSSSENIQAYVDKAQRLRQHIKEKILNIMNQVDFILMPTAMGAIPLDQCKTINVEDPIKMQKCDLFSVVGNLTGFPAISIPVGYDENHSPFGVDLLGKPMGEDQIIDLGEKLEGEFSQVYEDLMRKIME